MKMKTLLLGLALMVCALIPGLSLAVDNSPTLTPDHAILTAAMLDHEAPAIAGNTDATPGAALVVRLHSSHERTCPHSGDYAKITYHATDLIAASPHASGGERLNPSAILLSPGIAAIAPRGKPEIGWRYLA